MKKLLSVAILFLILCTLGHAQKEVFDRKMYYQALSSDDLTLVDAQLLICKSLKGKNGYEAAMLMRKAGLVGAVTQKFSFFKNGSKMMDEAILANIGAINTELRYLRLMVQEQAPRILGYRDNLKSDASHLKLNYKELPSETLYALRGYCKKSDILSINDFK